MEERKNALKMHVAKDFDCEHRVTLKGDGGVRCVN